MAGIDDSNNKPIQTSNAMNFAKIDKSMLHFGEIRRLRDKVHLRLSRRSLACCADEILPILTICALLNPDLWGAKRATNSWFRYAGLTTVKTTEVGDEISWWKRSGIDPLAVADKLRGFT